MNVEFYAFPSPAPGVSPPELEAGGRYMFEIDGLEKLLPDGTTAKLELGDTVELFVEVFDKNPAPRPPARVHEGSPPQDRRERRRGRRTPSKMRDEQNKRLQDKIRDLAADQENVFKPKPKEPPKPKARVPKGSRVPGSQVTTGTLRVFDGFGTWSSARILESRRVTAAQQRNKQPSFRLLSVCTASDT